MGSRPIPQPQPAPPRNPPLATSLDIQFSYGQRQLPPANQVVGSNPSFLAFTSDDDEAHDDGQHGGGSGASPYAYYEHDEDDLSSEADARDQNGHGRRASEDWWDGSESEDGGGEDDADRDQPTAMTAGGDEVTPKPAYSTLPRFPASLGRAAGAFFGSGGGRRNGPSPVATASSLARSKTPTAPVRAPPAPPQPPPPPARRANSYGFPSTSLPRTSSTSPSYGTHHPPPSPGHHSPSSPPAPSTSASGSRSFLAPFRALLSRARSPSASTRRRPSSAQKDELRPLLPQSHPPVVAGPSSAAGSTSSPAAHASSSSSLPPMQAPTPTGPAPNSVLLPSPALSSAFSERSASRRARRKARPRTQLVAVFLTAGAVLALVALGAGLIVFLLGG